MDHDMGRGEFQASNTSVKLMDALYGAGGDVVCVDEWGSRVASEQDMAMLRALDDFESKTTSTITTYHF
jgi:hypothetical protein